MATERLAETDGYIVTGEQVNGVDILQFPEKITMGVPNLVTRNAVWKVLGEGRSKLLLDIRKVNDIDMSGIGGLILRRNEVIREGGQIKLWGLTHNITNLLVILRLLGSFDDYNTRSAALASFK